MTLADKIEQADAPCRELDVEIVRFLCPEATIGEYIVGDDCDVVFHAEELGIPNKATCPHYTASIDAAMTLVPEHCCANIYISPEGKGGAEVYSASGQRASNAATPALALAAAAMRARGE